MTWRSLFVMMVAAAAHCSLFATRSLLSNTVRTVIQSLTLTLLINWLRLDRFSWSKEQRRKGSEKRYRSQKVKRLVKRDQRSGRLRYFSQALVAVIILSPQRSTDLLSSCIGPPLLPYWTVAFPNHRLVRKSMLLFLCATLRHAPTPTSRDAA